MIKSFLQRSIKYFLLLPILFTYQNLLAQCGTQINTNQFEQLKNYKNKFAASRLAVNLDSLINIPIKIHIITKDDGTGGVEINEVFKGLFHTNRLFKPAYLQFYICGSVNYIKSSEFYTIDYLTEQKYASQYDVSNAINIYYGGDVMVNGQSFGGYAYMPGGLPRIMMSNSSAGSVGVLSHEMGHFYGLPHTFNDSDHPNLSLRELVTRGSGANCSTAGDLICDTPADPYVFGSSQSYYYNCVYTKDTVDRNGDKFAPLLNNLMSYYSGCATEEVTPGQIQVIKSYKFHESRIMFNCNGPAVMAPGNLIVSSIDAGLHLKWNDNSTNEEGFSIEVSLSQNGPFSMAGIVLPNTTSYLFKDINPFTTYYFRVKPVNTLNAYSNVATITTQKQYCAPSRILSCNQDFLVSMDRVSIFGETLLQRNSLCEEGGYSFYNLSSSKVFKGETYLIRVSQAANTDGSRSSAEIGVWIDFNDNGYLKEQNEFFKLEQTTWGTFETKIQIPSTATIGLKRTRIRMLTYGDLLPSSYCIENNYGETEDYNLNIQEYPTTFPIKLSVSHPHKYEVKVSWTYTGITATTKCYVESSNSVNGNYSIIDSVFLSENTFSIKPSYNGGYYYRLRLAADKQIASNKAGVEVTDYSIPFDLKAYALHNIVYLTWNGDSAYFKKAILQKKTRYSNYQLVDTVLTRINTHEDFKLSVDDITCSYRMLDLEGNVIANIPEVKLTVNHCKPVFNTCFLEDWQVGIRQELEQGSYMASIFVYSQCYNPFYELLDAFILDPAKEIQIEIYNDMECIMTQQPKSVQNNVAMWIDFNEDMIFNANEKILSTNYANMDCHYIAPITIPEATDGGPKRIRIITTPANTPISDPCGSYVSGRSGDYYLMLNKPNLHTSVLEEAFAKKIRVLPNPSENGTFQVECESSIEYINVYDVLGHLILKTTDDQVENLKTGMYFISVKTGNQLYKEKVLVK